MKATRTWLLLPALAALSFLASPARAQAPPEKVSLGEKRVEKLAIPPLDWTVPRVGREVARDTLSAGVVLYVYPDHRFPLVNVLVRFRAGDFYEPAGKAGLANMALNLMRTGGTRGHDYRAMDEALDFLAARVQVSAGDEACDLDLNVLRKDLEQGLGLLSEMVREPTYPEDRIAFRKDEIKASIRRQNDNPRSAVTRQFGALLFGDHPYGRYPEWDRIQAITAADLHDYHDRFYVPGNCWIAVSGDVTPAEARAALEAAFAGWKRAPVAFPPHPEESEQVAPPAVVLYQNDLTQTAIAFGKPGLTMTSPDLYAAQVLNYVLGGGGFASRLLQQVRDRAGLAYSVFSSLPTDRTDPGPFVVQCQTKTASTVQALELMRKIVAGMAAEPVPAGEFKAAQDALVNGFVRDFSSPEDVVEALMDLEFSGRSADFYQGYMERIRAVTPDQVQGLAARLLPLDSMITVMIGNVEQFKDALGGAGKVEVRPLPEPEVE